MKRPRRIIFHALAAMSLVLCVGAAALWRRSMSTADYYLYFSRRDEPNSIRISTGLGGIELSSVTFLVPYQTNHPRWVVRHKTPAQYPQGEAPIPLRTFVGFGGGHGANRPGESFYGWHSRSAVVPIWFLVILFAVMPVLWIRRYRKSKRPRDGLCISCGYDLRATPDRCPECGTMPTKAAT